MTPSREPIQLRAAGRIPAFSGNGQGLGRPQMNRSQRAFYEKEFRPGFLSGDPVGVGDQNRYVTAMLYELIDTLGIDSQATAHIRRLVSTYRAEVIFPDDVIADSHFIDGDFEAGLRALGTRVSWSYYLNLAASTGHPRISPLTVFHWSSNYITKRGQRGFEEIFEGLESTFDEFHDVHGVSVMEEFWLRLISGSDRETIAASIQDEVIEAFSAADVLDLLRVAEERTDAPPEAFYWYDDAHVSIKWPAPWRATDFYEPLLFWKCRQLIRQGENAYRAGEGLPLVGQGWVSEISLFRELQTAFPDERIVHQGRPWWLGRQSLDVFFPDKLVGVEYQGAQHSRPVDFFGGAEAFERQQERDGWKQALCDANGCALITVHPGYDLVEVISAVRTALAKPQ